MEDGFRGRRCYQRWSTCTAEGLAALITAINRRYASKLRLESRQVVSQRLKRWRRFERRSRQDDVKSRPQRSLEFAISARVIVPVPMPVFAYRYELRRGEEVVSTGHLTQERALEVGERIEIGGVLGIVRVVEPVMGEREFRLVVQLWREGAAT